MIIIDDFLPKDSLALETITDDSLWQESLPYSWLGSEEAAKDVWQQMSVHIWGEISKFGIMPEKFDGVEYWSNAMVTGGAKEDLPWHYDKDEQLYDGGNGELRTPYIGSVYYAHKEIPDGGFLEIDREGDAERIQPVPNRLIIFDSAKVHRVVPITSGLRRTFATNVWIEKPREENFK
jgi:hypothetical protein